MSESTNTATVPAPKRADYVPLSQVRSVAQALTHPETLERFRAAAPSHVSPERMVRMTYTAVMNNADLQECPMWTLLRAALTFGSLGIEPNSPLGHGYLIPFRVKGKMQVQAIVGYKGFIVLAANAGIKGCHGDVVYEGDDFRYQYGTERGLWHRPRGSRYGRNPTEAYAVLGDEFEARDWGDVLEIRNRSQGYQAALRAKEQGRAYAYDANPWVRDPHPMGAKTMIRSVSRFVPMTIQMAAAVEIDGRAESGQRADLRDINTGLDIAFIEGLPEDKDDMSGAVQGANLGQQEKSTTSARDAAATTPTTTGMQTGGGRPGQETRQDPGAGQDVSGGQTSSGGDATTPAAVVLYLMDTSGEPEADDAGNFAIWTDAVQWAEALRNRLERAPVDQRQALVEHNADTMQDARAAAAGAASILDRIHDLTGEPVGTINLIRDSAGRIDVAATVAMVRDHAYNCHSIEALNHLDAAVRGFVSELPPSAKRIITQVWRGRVRAIQDATVDRENEPGSADQASNLSAPTTNASERLESSAPTAGSSESPPVDRDRQRVDMLIAEVRATTNVWALDEVTRSAAHTVVIDRYGREQPDLAVDYRSAVTQHRNHLSGSPDGENA